MEQQEKSILQRVHRVGKVSSVDETTWTCRVIFPDLLDKDGNPLVSGNLQILKNVPMVTIEGWEAGTAWSYTAHYATYAGRTDGVGGESFTKQFPDECVIKKTDEYTISSSEDSDELNHEEWKHRLKIRPWLPWVGQNVLCEYLPVQNGDGYVIGGF